MPPSIEKPELLLVCVTFYFSLSLSLSLLNPTPKQYGHVTMFAVAFPLAPLLALLRCLVEIYIDHQKLVRSRRPSHVDRSVVFGENTAGVVVVADAVVAAVDVVFCFRALALHEVAKLEVLSGTANEELVTLSLVHYLS